MLYRGHSVAKLQKLGENAYAWLFVESDAELVDPCSFASVCASLNMEIEFVRDRVRAVTEEDARRLRGLDFDDEDR